MGETIDSATGRTSRRRVGCRPIADPRPSSCYVSARRMKFLSAPDLPREVFAALLEGPAFLTGVTSDQRAALVQSYRATYHAEDIAQIAQAQEALELLDAVHTTVANEAARVGGFMSHEFGEFAKANGDK